MEVTVRVPATTANLGPGFDSMGMALAIYGEVTLKLGATAPLIENAGQRLVFEAAAAAFRAVHHTVPGGLTPAFRKNIPAGRGLGGSALARAAGLVAANTMMGDALSREELLAIGADLEGHPDNITPALCGGLQVITMSGEDVVHVRVPIAPGLRVVVMVPDFDMPTDESRKALPESLSRTDAIHNISRAALTVAALTTGRFDALRVSTQDRLHQPSRARIFPALQPAIDAALAAGACGAFLSGGGSSVLALTSGQEEAIGRAMVGAAGQHGFTAEYIVTAPEEEGAVVVEKK